MDNVEKQTEATDRILESAFILFRQYGIRAITMDEIANHMGMSKKTIYAHFADKDEMVTNCIVRRIEEIQSYCIKLRENAKDAVEEIFLTMQFIEGLFRNMNPIILMDMQKFHPAAFKAYHEYMHKYVMELIRKNLERGIAEGLYREDMNLEIISRFRLEASTLCFRIDIFPKNLFEMSQVQVELMQHFMYGITTPKGYKLIQAYKQKHFSNKK